MGKLGSHKTGWACKTSAGKAGRAVDSAKEKWQERFFVVTHNVHAQPSLAWFKSDRVRTAQRPSMEFSSQTGNTSAHGGFYFTSVHYRTAVGS